MTPPIDYELLSYNRLKGKYKHYCIEWDGMAIDETYPEFLACSCWDKELSANQWLTIQKDLRDYLMIEDKRL